MRVLVIGSGGLMHTEPYLRAMLHAGWDVHWLLTRPGPLHVDGVTLHQGYGGGRYDTDWAKLGYFYWGIRARRLIRHLGPDIIHAHYASSAGLMAWLSGYRPYAVTIHGSDLIDRSKTRIGRAVLRRVLGGAALVNPVAGHMLELLGRLRVPQERILVLPFGIDLQGFPYQPRKDLFRDGIRLVCNRSLGALTYDIPTVLRAVAEARRLGRRVFLSLPATGRLAPELKQLAADLGIADAVAFGSGYRNDEVPAMLAAHDVYVSASLWDGASLSLMEAMACGAFPVVSDIPANLEWLRDGETALLFPVGDWRRLGKIIATLPDRRDLIARAVAWNRQTIEARGDRGKNMALLLERLQAVTTGAG